MNLCFFSLFPNGNSRKGAARLDYIVRQHTATSRQNTATAYGNTMTAQGDNLRSLIFKVDGGKASLSVLDQLLLPHQTKYVPVNNVEDAW